ncbi:amino acid ABC transporter substrate-binding protein (PAAT family) [Dongia mobilis]|uniref:Amino acid ABC transporter substrate-binding protein (PAAT family) n=2 Tax=Dongia mobilis TaxID=578943 RepID=A0A4R6WUG2_9PROT|nr:amino acid ABC transporter substrate-binding protein (PAAT family) [Dongia mobilis]
MMVAGVLLAAFPAAAPADTIRLRADYWCPYNCMPEDPRPGYMVDLAARALAAAGHEADYQLMPWDRALEEVADGRIDAVIGATPLESQGLVLSVPLGRDHDCFFVRRDSMWAYRGPASLNEVLLGVVAGYTHDEGPIDAYVDAHDGPGGTVVASRDDEGAEKNVGLLLRGRVDAILDSEAVIRFVAKQAGRADEIKTAGCLAPLTLHIAFSPRRPDSEELAAALERQMEAMRADGSLAALLADYGLSDWE